MRKLDGQLKGTGIVDTFKLVVPRGGMQGLVVGFLEGMTSVRPFWDFLGYLVLVPGVLFERSAVVQEMPSDVCWL